MKNFNPALVLYLIFCAAASASAQSQDIAFWENGITERWWVSLKDISESDLDRATELWAQIQKENERGDTHPWAGGYSDGGETHGSYMRWSPEAGFVIANINKCEAKLMGLSFGSVKIAGPLIEFVIDYQFFRSHGHRRSHRPGHTRIRFVPIQWSHTQFLVEEKEMARFGDYVAGLGEFNGEYMWLATTFFSRKSSEIEDDHSNIPQAPEQYQRFIRAPIDARIIQVGTPRLKRYRDSIGQWHLERLTPVTVNVGRVDGVRTGLALRVLVPDLFESVKITRVGSRTSLGVIERGVDEEQEPDSEDVPISVGWQLTTSPHKRSTVGSQ